MALPLRLLSKRSLQISPCARLLPVSNQARFYSTGQVSSLPGSDNMKELKENAKEEMSTIKKDIADTIGVANSRTSQLNTGEGAAESITKDFNSITEIGQVVPKQALFFGAAGLLPYLGTSATAVYLSYQARLANTPGTGSTLDVETAMALLHHVENIQIGYGAIILSFIGSLHWGFEFAKFGGVQGTPRYVLGIFPVMIAMPTLLLPNQLALISQWAAFAGTWWLDQRATTMGWAPRWFSTYRFWLTAIVGSSILISLGGENYFGPGANLATTAHNLDKANQEAANEMAGKDIRQGRVIKGTIEGDVKATPSEEAYVQLTNVPRKIEEEKKKKKEAEEKKAKEAEEAKKKEEEDQKKQAAEEKAKKNSGGKTPGA